MAPVSLVRHHAVARPVLGLLMRQHGQALPVVLGAMVIFSVSVGSVMVVSASSQRSTDAHKKGSYANAAAEAALATAISVLGTANETTVQQTTLLPSCLTTLPGEDAPGQPLNPQPPKAKGYYCGQYLYPNWTLKATGVAKHTSGEAAQVQKKIITQVATLTTITNTGLGELWNRIYQSDPSRCTEFKKMIVTIPVVTQGCLKLTGDDTHPSRVIGPYVTVGGKTDFKDQDSIGTPGTPPVNIPRAVIVGNCKVEHGLPEHPAPCGPADRVYADVVGTTADFTKPTMDFAAAYAGAKPGPNQTCTTGALGTGMKFDKNVNYNRDNDPQQLTPNGVSYDCQVWASGQMVGQIKWDAVEQVFTVNGTVFFDGDVKITAPGHSKACAKADHGPYCDKSFSYNGKGMLWSSGKMELEAGLCSGGDGGNDCETDPANWDPKANLLIIVSGGLKNLGDETFKMDKDEAVFQGAVWSYGKCKIGKKASVSSPLICGQLAIKEDDTIDDPTVNPWPASLITRGNQIWTSPTGAIGLVLQPQLGG